MSISSSLNAGVSGLNANATRLATISDNIANSSTYGYKRMTADFASLVIGSAPGMFAAGGVRASTARMVDQQGSITSTSNPTDIAVAGRGMVPVTTAVAAAAGGPLPMLMTPTGSFRPDANGILRSDSGLVLLGVLANIDGTIPPFARDVSTALRPVQVNTNQFVGNPTTFVDVGVTLPATATRPGAEATEYPLTIELFDSVGVGTTLTAAFTNVIPPSNGGAGDLVGTDATARTEQDVWLLTLENIGAPTQEVLVRFDTNGRPQAWQPVTRDALDNIEVDPAGPTVIDPLDADSGAVTFSFLNPAVNPDIRIMLDQVAGGRGLTQLSDRFTPIAIGKDGAPVGDLVSVEVDSRGMVNAIYDNGFSRTIYQVPLVDVPNPNGLTSLSNQTYRISRASGDFFLWNAGEGPTGEMVGFAREESTVDVAGELTSLIQTQRAYSSNAKVIQTVDEMLQETTNIKR